MKKQHKILLFIAIGIIVLLVLFLFYTMNKRQYSWYENYKVTDKNPYGLYLLRNLFNHYFEGKEVYEFNKSISNSLKIESQKSNYIFIGENYSPAGDDIKFLLKYVESGNTAFIASKEIPYELINELTDDLCDDWGYYVHNENVVKTNFSSATLNQNGNFNFSYVYYNEPELYNWHYWDQSCIWDSVYKYEHLGFINDSLPNFIKLNYGKGALLIHTNPILFTNLFIKEESGRLFASGVFSYLSEGDIYWDEFSKTNLSSGWGGASDRSPGPFDYILSKESLRWAWYLMLILVLIYAIFFAKRRQRIIPLIIPKPNTSLEYILNISKLYMKFGNHTKICEQKMKTFLFFIRSKYHLSTKDLSVELTRKIAVKSNVPIENVKEIFDSFNAIQASKATNNKSLIHFYTLIENFYKKAK